MQRAIYIGFDPREAAAFAVARYSVNRQLRADIPIHGLVLSDLVAQRLYTRPMEFRDHKMWDIISDAPMSTQHANARFLVPYLAIAGWALFMDGDMLVRGDLATVFNGLDKRKALYCVKHQYQAVAGTKMDGQLQTVYPRKNWSSLMIFNCSHPANTALTTELVNKLPGRELHRFCWLKDEEIGELDPKWNFLVGISDPSIKQPAVVHFTSGTPDMPGYEHGPFTDEWRAELARWAS